MPDVIQHNVAQELRSLILTPAEIEVILKSLPIGKAAGQDGISNRILRELATEPSYILCSLFNQSLQMGTFPNSCKLSNVCLIPKTSDRSSVCNFRPVSLLCTSEKVFETGFSPLVKYFTDRSKAALLLWILYVIFSVLCLLCLCVRLFICALGSPVRKGLTSWLSYVMSKC